MKNPLPRKQIDKDPAATTARGINTTHLLLRLLRATQPVSRIELATRLKVNRSTVSEILNPLINAGIIHEKTNPNNYENSPVQGRPRVALSFDDEKDFFVGVNLGVRHTQVGLVTLSGKILAEIEFQTPESPTDALSLTRNKIDDLCQAEQKRTLRTIGVSVPGPTDAARRKLLYAPNLGWSEIAVADSLKLCRAVKKASTAVHIIVENDATAAAMFEARLKLRQTAVNLPNDFILVRSGTGIGVGLIIGGEIYRGNGRGTGIAGEFGHMTILAGGKSCVCGNRGCWEKYASASSASSLYAGERALNPHGKQPPGFVEIVARAEAGEVRARRTLEQIGGYLGIGVANVIMGVGIAHVIISGRLVYGWKYINVPLRNAVEKSIAGKLSSGWTIECGEPKGSALGGALEVAVEHFLASVSGSARTEAPKVINFEQFD